MARGLVWFLSVVERQIDRYKRNDLTKRKDCYRIGVRGVLLGTVVQCQIIINRIDTSVHKARLLLISLLLRAADALNGNLVKYDWKVLRTLLKYWKYDIIS